MTHRARPRCTSLLLAFLFCHSAAFAQASPAPPSQTPTNVVTLSAEASAEVTQDLLSITLGTTKEGADAAAVQSQLRQALDAALTEARKAARPKLLEVRTGAFSLVPHYASKPNNGGSTITGWQGRTELVIEGSDIAAISQLAGRLTTLSVARTAFGLSREAREQMEADVAAQAIGRFKARAESYAKQFGFGGYSLREVAVGGGEVGSTAPLGRMRVMGAAMAEELQPVEAGKALVSVTVSGSVQLSPR
jgi:hypothetical protein